MNKRIRQYIGLLSAVLMYYIIHEGAHLLYALSTGVFRQINFMGIGMQIGIYEERMSETGLGIFCSVGVAATMITADATSVGSWTTAQKAFTKTAATAGLQRRRLCLSEKTARKSFCAPAIS